MTLPNRIVLILIVGLLGGLAGCGSSYEIVVPSKAAPIEALERVPESSIDTLRR